MFFHKLRAAALVFCLCAAALRQGVPGRAWQHTKAGNKPGNARAAVLASVSQFEQAYKSRDRQTMLMKLMVPSTDNAVLEKRYQWLRGFGPKDLPGTKHQPILFEGTRGSFVPASYTVLNAAPIDGQHWDVTVREQGSYRDEDGKWAVTRVRHIKLTSYKGRWMVMDYVLKENPEDYGFYVDDIVDKMTKAGK